MKLSNEDWLSATITVLNGDTFRKGNVLLFPLSPDEYCVQKAVGPVTDKNRIITQSWSEAISSFEKFLEE